MSCESQRMKVDRGRRESSDEEASQTSRPHMFLVFFDSVSAWVTIFSYSVEIWLRNSFLTVLLLILILFQVASVLIVTVLIVVVCRVKQQFEWGEFLNLLLQLSTSVCDDPPSHSHEGNSSCHQLNFREKLLISQTYRPRLIVHRCSHRQTTSGWHLEGNNLWLTKTSNWSWRDWWRLFPHPTHWRVKNRGTSHPLCYLIIFIQWHHQRSSGKQHNHFRRTFSPVCSVWKEIYTHWLLH